MSSLPGLFDRARGHAAVKIACAAVLLRLFSALLAFLANVLFPDYQREQFTVFGTTSPFWDAFARNDSGWYWQIARYGYTEGPSAYVPGGRSSIAFFPAYPMLMGYVGRAIGRRPADLYVGGILVSWAAFVAAAVLLYYVARLDLPRRGAARASLLAAIFPFAFFYGVVYTEALFLAATLGAFYGFRTGRWLTGGLAGALATATRVNGILMWPALAWIAWCGVRASGQPRREAVRAALGLALVGAGVGLYSLYIYRLSGNPFEWAASIQRWGYHPGGSPIAVPIHLIRNLLTRPYAYLAGEGMAPYDTFNGLTALLFVVSVPFVWRRLGAGYGLFMAANLWLPLSSGQFEGLGRYCAVLFPFFIWAAGARSEVLHVGWAIASAMLYAIGLALFANIHPIL